MHPSLSISNTNKHRYPKPRTFLPSTIDTALFLPPTITARYMYMIIIPLSPCLPSSPQFPPLFPHASPYPRSFLRVLPAAHPGIDPINQRIIIEFIVSAVALFGAVFAFTLLFRLSRGGSWFVVIVRLRFGGFSLTFPSSDPAFEAADSPAQTLEFDGIFEDVGFTIIDN
jgi:hypothetical protein